MLCALVDGADDVPVRIVGDDACTYLTDRLSRLPHPAAVIEVLERLADGPPLILEGTARSRRLVLPAAMCVVDLRGRRRLDSVVVLDEVRSRRAIDSLLRLLPAMSDLVERFGEPRRVYRDIWLLMDGRCGVERLTASGGFRLLSDTELCATLLEQAREAAHVDAIDDLVASWFSAYGRREQADPRHRAEVAWHLAPLGLVLSRDAAGVLTTRAVAENTTPA